MQIHVDIPTVGAIVAMMTPIVGGATWLIDMRVEKRISEMELRLRDWINGSFLRASEIETRFEAEDELRKELRAQIEDLRTRGCTRLNEGCNRTRS